MEPLAKLPVFFDLAGQRAVVAGGTAATAWKAELLAAAGANVDIYAAVCSEDMQGLIERGTVTGTIRHVPQHWTPGVLARARIALGDFESDREAHEFSRAAKAAGVPVNVIDKPSYCDVQFGTIVNRSPVVIGISTDGAAPILGQAIRRRIETLLPAAISGWAKLAKDLRGEVLRRLPLGRQRRTFWEKFADKAFAGAAPATADRFHETIGAIANSTDEVRGRVTLVGAGPGDPELLTLKAVRAMQSADVILFDDLVSSEILELARREARRMLVGKRGGRESCRQDDINDLMVKLAGQGKHVVRLKAGDPMIFGRAGEEIARLREEGIAVSVVPGISSASAMAAGLGASLTHRDFAHSVRFVTGHSRHGQLPADLDWQGLADPETTLVFFMGGRTAPAIALRLMQEGLDAATPVAVQIAVSRAEEDVHRTTLRALADQEGFRFDGRPTLIGIGRAFQVQGSASVASPGFEAERRLNS